MLRAAESYSQLHSTTITLSIFLPVFMHVEITVNTNKWECVCVCVCVCDCVFVWEKERVFVEKQEELLIHAADQAERPFIFIASLHSVIQMSNTKIRDKNNSWTR